MVDDVVEDATVARRAPSSAARDPDSTSQVSYGPHEPTLHGRDHDREAAWRPEGSSPPLQPSWPRVGRYELRAQLGSGGMGAVYEAIDPSLHRPVAVKVLHAGLPVAARRRMQREALALARVSHPNVVQVFEVGEDGGHPFIAMELVRGVTLDAWVRERPGRSWDELVRTYAQVGAGLAAAHAAGLVHRDLKPSNCIMGNDGRVRVVDFGLAKDVGLEGDEVDDARSHGGEPLEQGITAWGAMVGTPAYMAPEQILGRPAAPATDQFSLCVSLWEALHGQRPFQGETLGELAMRVLAGNLTEPPTAARVPRWLRGVVERGLAPEPAARWPSMRALLDALEHGRARARRRRAAQVLGLAGAMITAIVAWQRWDRAQRSAVCHEEGASIGAVWNDDVADSVRAALMGTGVVGAERTAAAAVRSWLDLQAGAWAQARTEACLDARVRGAVDLVAFDRTTWCLDERRTELEALVMELEHPRARTVDRAVKAAAGLKRVDRCLDATLLSRLPDPPTQARESIASARGMLSHAHALQQVGAYDDGLAKARAALARAEELAWPPLVVDAQVRVGTLLEKTGDYQGAERMLEDAYFGALRAEAIEAAADAAGVLVQVEGIGLQRYENAILWARHEEVLVSSLPDRAGAMRLRQLSNLANARFAMGAYDEAKALNERALALAEAALGSEHPDVGTLVHNLGAAEQRHGDLRRASSLFERAVSIRSRALGPEHPDVGTSLSGLGVTQAMIEHHDDAMISLEQALYLREHHLGPTHPRLAESLANLASLHHELGELDEARAFYERAIRVTEQALGPEHPALGSDLAALASVLRDQGELDEALALGERALRIEESSFGSEHPSVAKTLTILASLLRDSGETERAGALYERALGVSETTLGPTHPDLAHPLLGASSIALANGRSAAAVAFAGRALQLLEQGSNDSGLHAQACFVLAMALWDAGDDRTRALALAEQARETYVEREDPQSVTAVDAWLEPRR